MGVELCHEVLAPPWNQLAARDESGAGIRPTCIPAGCVKVSDDKVTGNKVTWSMKCEGPEAMSGTGEITYGENTYDGVMKMERQGQTMTMKYTGKRLGDCLK